MDSIGKQARIGLHFLKNAVAEILFHSRHEAPLQPDDIRKRLGIPKTDNQLDRTNTLIFDILFLLEIEGQVEVVREKGGGWKITEAGILRQINLLTMIDM